METGPCQLFLSLSPYVKCYVFFGIQIIDFPGIRQCIIINNTPVTDCFTYMFLVSKFSKTYYKKWGNLNIF
jgi:hypothetical protein